MNRSSFGWGLLAGLVALAGCAETPPEEGDVLVKYEGPIQSDDVQGGEQVFTRLCVSCHDGEGGSTPVLKGLKAKPAQVRMQVREGEGEMPAIGLSKLPNVHLESLLAYLVTIDAVDDTEEAEGGPTSGDETDVDTEEAEEPIDGDDGDDEDETDVAAP
ncbi:MAG: c-type cytochrome [Myxococcota bacterium]